jgi:two-component system chemotaxis response regulator CheY
VTVRALVVDDSASLRKSLVLALRRIEGLSCVEAGDGAEGLKQLNQGRFDIVLTDINMPVMDGLKLVAAIRQSEEHREIPVVVITTESDAQDRARALALGANRYMIKPVQAPEVIAAVKELLHLS